MKTEIKAISASSDDTFNFVLEREMKGGWTPIPESFNICRGDHTAIFGILLKRVVDTSPQTIRELGKREGTW